MPIPDISADALDLVTKKLADQVQKRIISTFAAIATAIFAAGGFAAYDLAEDVRQTAIAAAQKTVQEIVEIQVKPAAQTAQNKIDEASETLMEAQLRIVMVDDALERILAKAKSAEEKAIETLARTGRTLTQTETELSALRDKVGGLHAETNDQLKTLRDAFADLATLSSLNADVHSLAKQVGALDEVVQALVQHASGVSVLDRAQLTSLSSSVAPVADLYRSGATNLRIAAGLRSSSQFADMSNDLAREISVELRSKRYVVPGEARENMNRGTREVRYFRDDDLEQAQRLAADVAAALASIGLHELPVEVKPVTAWIGAKPRPHTLEVWLSVPEHAPALEPRDRVPDRDPAEPQLVRGG